jgi:hypothetical protein
VLVPRGLEGMAEGAPVEVLLYDDDEPVGFATAEVAG